MPRVYRYISTLPALIITVVLFLLSHGLTSAQSPVRIIWLHHSVGAGIIDGGGVREGLSALGHEFYDHGYNGDGLRLADGSTPGTTFDVPGDNTDPDGFADIFNQPVHNPPDNTLSHLMQYDVIMIKSCFPTSNIGDDAQLEADKGYYRTIAKQMDQYPDKLLILVTHPPQVPNSTDSDEAQRARALNDWLLSDAFLSGHPNLFVFDLFGRLAGGDNLLRSNYRVSDDDAHPNDIANAAIGPELVDFVDQAIRSAWGNAPRPQSSSSDGLPAEEPAGDSIEQPPAAGAVATDVIDDFEAGADAWHADTDRPETIIECGADSEFAHSGNASLRLHYEIAPDGYVTCGHSFDETQNWGGATGISLWLMADTPDQWVTLGVYSGALESPTPFEISFAVPPNSLNAWAQVIYAWTDFERAGWADAGGLQALDPARVTGYSLSLGAGEETVSGIMWMDDVELVEGRVATTAEEDEPEEDVEQDEPDIRAEKKLCGGVGAVLLLPLAAGMVMANRRRCRVIG
ncbi:MAG: SGNH/GDSL hydrolase family protein [Anaerolineae bacterium]|nr:SGNH/GDSL hydrolase family protein [Anaerolineae bacterium]